MKTYTDEQYKQLLVKMLPEQLILRETTMPDTEEYYCYLIWRNERKPSRMEVLDTELLHLCWFVEETLPSNRVGEYMESIDEDGDWAICHATWQQRVTALAKVKGLI